MPTSDAVKLARLSHGLSPVPAQYAQALHLDLAALREHPDVQAAHPVGEPGGTGRLPPSAAKLLDSLVVASRDGGEGLIVILDGPVDIASLIQVAGAAGITLGGTKAESHRDHRVCDIDFLGVNPNPPMDTDRRREDSGRVGEGATAEMAGLHCGRLEVGGRSSVPA